MSRTLTKKLASVKPGTLFIGVDLALDHNVAVVLTERAHRLARFGFPNDRDGYDYFYRRLEALRERQQAPEVLVGMEPTNYFWKLLAADLEQQQVPYRLVNPYTVKKHREGDQLDRSKDDSRDAFTIGDLLRTGKFTETRLLRGGYAELRQYVVLYDRLQRDIRRQKALIHNTAGQVFPELTRVFKDFTGVTALAMLRHHAAAAVVRRMSQEAFITGVRADLQGKRLQLARLRRAHRLATHSVGLKSGVQALQLALRLYIETLEGLQRQLEEVKTALIDTFLALPESRYLLSVHGLGLVTAAIILAEIGDPNNYSNGRQLIKLAGTQPVTNTTGRKTRSKTPMSHKGRSRLRTALFFAVMRLVQVDDAFAQEYLRLQQREKNPLTKMQALGVLMNKLLRILWALMRHRTFYNPGYQHAA
ncbi:MAG: IS110 family transposase [Chloroflexi bacterium]|nr:MAG: IS110 family transposase [Chloroflexota bacterium]